MRRAAMRAARFGSRFPRERSPFLYVSGTDGGRSWQRNEQVSATMSARQRCRVGVCAGLRLSAVSIERATTTSTTMMVNAATTRKRIRRPKKSDRNRLKLSALGRQVRRCGCTSDDRKPASDAHRRRAFQWPKYPSLHAATPTIVPLRNPTERQGVLFPTRATRGETLCRSSCFGRCQRFSLLAA